LETFVAFAPAGFGQFRAAVPAWLKDKLHHRRLIRDGLGLPPHVPIAFVEHHQAHAASAFYPSPFARAAVLTLDGVGEWATAASGLGERNTLTLDREIRFPHSLGLLYSAFTYYCGFKVNSGEYKLMGLAPYGRPTYRDAILGEVMDLRPDGSFHLDMKYFNYCQGLTMTSRRFDARFGGPPRHPESALTQRHMDLAASVQAATEEAVVRLAADLRSRTGCADLAMAGGVALNCVANGRLVRERVVDNLWVQPAAGDAGGALGAALFAHHRLLGKPREADGRHDRQGGSLLGPSYGDEEIRAAAEAAGLIGTTLDDTARDERVSELLASGKVVGWFQGRMEYGPRALGARSILGDARDPSMQARLNLAIKFRESFRPFAPIVLAERAAEWFDLRGGVESPYMLIVADVNRSRLLPISEADRATMESDPDLLRRVNVPRSTIPAATHVDGSARVQTVDLGRNPGLHALLSAFERRTGCPVLVNTSFNVRGEPIVCTPAEAIRCYLATGMDALAIGGHLFEKGDDRPAASRAAYLAEFALD